MVDSLKVGNKVITSGGIIGVIKEVDTKENLFEVEIAQGVIVKIIKSHVTDMVKKEEKKTKK